MVFKKLQESEIFWKLPSNAKRRFSKSVLNLIYIILEITKYNCRTHLNTVESIGISIVGAKILVLKYVKH